MFVEAGYRNRQATDKFLCFLALAPCWVRNFLRDRA